MRMGTTNGKGTQLDTLPLPFVSQQKMKDLEFQDPYRASAEVKARDISAYKNFCSIDAISFDLKRKRNALFLLHKVKLLLGKLASVSSIPPLTKLAKSIESVTDISMIQQTKNSSRHLI